jgi:DNA-binding PadR family transcriptional regulator
VQYAVLGLISSRRDGIHGYLLKSEFEDRFGDFWALNYGQMYRTLDRLERTGLIAGAEVPQVGRPPRRVYRITDRGKKSLDSWLDLPPGDGPRTMRDEVAVKLLFRSGERLRDLVDLVRKQRASTSGTSRG